MSAIFHLQLCSRPLIQNQYCYKLTWLEAFRLNSCNFFIVEIPIVTVFTSRHLVSRLNTFFLITVFNDKNLKLEYTTISLRFIAAWSKCELNKDRHIKFYLNLQHEQDRYLLIIEIVTPNNKDLALYLKIFVTAYLKLVTRLIWSCNKICNKSKSKKHIFSTLTLTWK